MANGHRKKGPIATKLLSHAFPSPQPTNSLAGPTRINEKNGANGRRNIASAIQVSSHSQGRIDHCSGGQRAAVKAKRRQWDPPKKARQPEAPASASSAAANDPPDDCAVPPISLTAAESFALATLLELHHPAPPLPEAATTPERPEDRLVELTPEPPDDLRPVESGIDLPEQGLEDVDLGDGSSELVSFHSSLEALNQEPIHRRRGDWENAFAKELPFYARPASTAQRKIQRELGVIGPLTRTQQMQIAAAALGDPFVGDPSEPDPVVEPSLSQQRWDWILEWRKTMFDNKWDAATQRDFAKAALSRLYRR
ncbi:hypothetical protein C8F04DRAFT_1202404 [Mycena alexandri]|uniref:Uncharacterized protein n=1 Tax=Mycena alexandri TaxID=1745969 RepID=A0AAD6RWC0_9AGAR|nr:hypothetical protein C8F04DRAFT_1202404 [Mycena alexandri]